MPWLACGTNAWLPASRTTTPSTTVPRVASPSRWKCSPYRPSTGAVTGAVPSGPRQVSLVSARGPTQRSAVCRTSARRVLVRWTWARPLAPPSTRTVRVRLSSSAPTVTPPPAATLGCGYLSGVFRVTVVPLTDRTVTRS